MRGGPLGSEARLGLSSPRLGETRRHGPFFGIDWVRPMGEARMVMIVRARPGRDWLGQGIGSWF